MPSLDRNRLMLDLFHGGIPEGLATPLALDSPPWLMLNVPAEFVSGTDDGRLPSTIDVVGGRLVPRSEADLTEIARRARWHFPGAEQRKARRRLATALALAEGFLRPSIDSLFALQFHAPCGGVGAEDLAHGLVEVGFGRAIVLVGDDATTTGDPDSGYALVRSKVEEHDDGLRFSVRGDPMTWPRSRPRAASKELRARMWRLLHKMHLPRRLPIVIDMGPHDGDG